MKRLDTILPEWTRTMWASERAKEIWQPRIDHINAAWSRIERWSVIDGARGSCLTFAEPKDLAELVRWASEHGVLALPMTQVGSLEQYSATPQPVTAGQGWQYRIVLCRPEFRDAWYQAWHDDTTNDETIGELLGFPECCRRFFREIWVEQKFLDTTWPMAVNTAHRRTDDVHELEVQGPDVCNILLRWLGVRAVAHLPCAFNCTATLETAKMLDQVGRDRHFGEAVDWTREMLSWPVEWSALHGIAEIKTPILKISSRTDMTAEKYVVQKLGSSYPAEGSHGLAFPYRTDQEQVQLTKTPAFARAFDPVQIESFSAQIREHAQRDAVTVQAISPTGEILNETTAGSWLDNGFSSLEAMDDAHDVLLDATPFAELKPGDEVLDLGCGNGRLLERLGELVPKLELYGIEVKHEVCRRARNGRGFTIYQGSMFDARTWGDLDPDLIFFMPGRLLENGGADFNPSQLRELLRRSERVVFYAYGDWLEKDGLLELLHRAELVEGWEKVGTVARAPNARAILARRR